MNCRTFKRNLEDYLQGGLDFPGRFGMERHAKQCLDCGGEIVQARKLSQAARGLAGVKAPPGFEESVLRRIRQEKARRRFRAIERFRVFGFEWASGRRLALAASVALIAVAGVLFVDRFWEHPVGDPVADSGLEFRLPSAVPAGEQVPGSPPAEAAVRTGPDLQSPEAASFSARALSAGYFDSERGFVPGVAEPLDSEFIEFEVPGPGDKPVIVRLPARVRLRYSHPSEGYSIRNVSH